MTGVHDGVETLKQLPGAILLVDASNTFNVLNRTTVINKMQHFCSPLAKYLKSTYTDTYREPAELYVTRSASPRSGGADLARV